MDDAALNAFVSGQHPRPYELLGAHPGSHGVRFAVWAPAASAVHLVLIDVQGERKLHPLQRCGDSGVWEGEVPGVQLGDRYQFQIEDAHGRKLPLKADPYARWAEFRPGTASRVAPMPQPRRLPADRAPANRRDAPISIYEVHLGSWRRNSDGGFMTWDELADALPRYAADLGFTHVELLPVSEHPYDGSWGYQTLGLFAPTSRFGSPDGLQRLVEACHARGLGVLLDWVPAHFPLDAHGMGQFDGTAAYEYADPREGFHEEWRTLIYDFGKAQVKSFLAGSALYWVERFGADGLRVDAVASMLYRDFGRPSGRWVPNVEGGRVNLEAASLLARINATLERECPGSMVVAEDSSTFPGVCKPVGEGGLGFHSKWNLGWMHDTLGYMQIPPQFRGGQHQRISFGLVYAFDEQFVLPLSHDEVVHGKRSIFGRMPGHGDDRYANLRAYYGFMWGHPGKKLLFMGQEFAQVTEWSHDEELPWHLLCDPRHAGIQALVRDLNRVYRELPALHQLDGERAGFEWLLLGDLGDAVFAWMRRGHDRTPAIVVCNFSDQALAGYELDLPEGPAAWRVALDTDAVAYGGEGLFDRSGPLMAEPGARGDPPFLRLDLAPLSTCFLVPV